MINQSGREHVQLMLIHSVSFHLMYIPTTHQQALLLWILHTLSIIEAGGVPVSNSTNSPACMCFCWMYEISSPTVAVFTTHTVTVEEGRRRRMRQAAAPARDERSEDRNEMKWAGRRTNWLSFLTNFLLSTSGIEMKLRWWMNMDEIMIVIIQLIQLIQLIHIQLTSCRDITECWNVSIYYIPFTHSYRSTTYLAGAVLSCEERGPQPRAGEDWAK